MAERFAFGGAGVGNTTIASTQISGLSSRQVVFGSPTGGLAQTALFEFDSTNVRLGIGTSAPTAKLSVRPPAAGGFAFDWYTSAGTQVGVINSSGHVGIGTTAPTGHLDVLATASLDVNLRRATTANYNLLGFWTGTTREFAIVQFGSEHMLRITRDAGTLNDLVLNSSGHLGIGTTIPTVPLEVVGSVRLVTSTANTLSFFGAAGTTRQGAYATTGTTSRTMNSTITPAAVYSSDVGAQLNALQAVVKCIIQDHVAYGLSPTTV